MNDDRASTDRSDDDNLDEAILAADATGMVAGERLITEAEIDEGLAGEEA